MDGAPAGTVGDQGITPDELRLAARNHGLPLEALRYPITPAGLHYLLIHYDIPAVDPATFQLRDRRRGRAAAHALPRRSAGTGARRQADHLRMRRQRPGAARAASGEPALADGGGRAPRSGAARLSRRCSRRPARATARSSSSSVLSTGASKEASRRPTSARCRSPRPATRSSPTR